MKPLAEELGIDPALITFQVLRRTFGTTMQKHGTMKDVQAHLRHASITTTGNIYVQEIPASVRSAVTTREILGSKEDWERQELKGSDSTVSNCVQIANQRRCKSLILLAPEVGLEPTTLRLTASEFPSPSTAIDCCKPLYTSRLDQFLSALRCYLYGLIATDFELAWAQKWAQSFQPLLDC
jgi:hypothetical protein